MRVVKQRFSKHLQSLFRKYGFQKLEFRPRPEEWHVWLYNYETETNYVEEEEPEEVFISLSVDTGDTLDSTAVTVPGESEEQDNNEERI